ncbi:MAG: ABC transporter ATP-binding protein [Ruminococcus sp.]|uniref:ABC transporter ATP-binding protein n=1 Tax=Ruminococcus sp. TaxID=41978 RepID=UPI0025FD3BFF|nr:ABC transporter ATP-binding protein [Ruminococcus sp.]MCR5602038.1 ABC transporter ATP-binding protein [Ruminococcus sp.]
MFLTVDNVKKSYGEGEAAVRVLDGVSTSLEKGKICTILGPSGSGKSTLLNLIGGLDSADSGKVVIDGQEITAMDPVRLEHYRRDYLGFIFQFYNLIPNLTLRENIQVCEYLSDKSLDIDELLEALGLTEHQKKFPSQVSGGQQQRCAIARALVKNPRMLLCDEPTGALDSHTAKEILILLEEVNKKYGTTIVIVTHNIVIQEMSHKVIRIRDGKIIEDRENKNIRPAESLTL